VGQLLRAKVRTTFQSLAERNYRLFAAGQLTKQLGVWIQFVAQDWLVLDLTDNSASALGLITGIQFLPVVLLSLYGGKLADRYDKRRLLVWTNACYFALGLVMGVLVSTGVITLALVFVVAALMGVVNAIENPLRQSFISELVERPLLPNALGLASSTRPASSARPWPAWRSGRSDSARSSSSPRRSTWRRWCSCSRCARPSCTGCVRWGRASVTGPGSATG
jgi:hypothetical protein